MTCAQWNKAVAQINELPEDLQKTKMTELYKKLEDNVR